MNTKDSDDWYKELEGSIKKLFQADKINFDCFESFELWEKFSRDFITSFEKSRFKVWDGSESVLDGFTNYINRAKVGVENFDKDYCKKQAERLLKLLTNFDGFAITGNSNKVDLTFQKKSSQKCNLVWLLIIIAYLVKKEGAQYDFYKFACSFNDLVENLKIGVNNQPEPEVQVNQPSEGTIKAKATETKPKKGYSTTNQADTLILILAQKYLLQLQEIGQKKQLESNDIDSVLKNYEWVWHGDANKKPDSFKADTKGNLCWIEICFDKSKSKKSISSRIEFNDLMKAINNDATFVKSLRIGEPFQMNGSGLTEKGFKKI